MRPITVTVGPPGAAQNLVANVASPPANTNLTLLAAAASISPASQISVTSTNTADAGQFYIEGVDVFSTPHAETDTMALIGGTATILTTAKFSKITRIVPLFTPAGTIAVQTPAALPTYSAPVRLDDWADAPVSVQVVVSGTVSYTVQHSYDDPNDLFNPVAQSNMFWDSGLVPAGAVGGGASITFGIAIAPVYMRLALNSGTGSARMTVLQYNVYDS